jgi:hypothetical protein
MHLCSHEVLQLLRKIQTTREISLRELVGVSGGIKDIINAHAFQSTLSFPFILFRISTI